MYTLSSLKSYFHSEIDSIYGREEVSSLFFIGLKKILQFSRLQYVNQSNLEISEDIFGQFNELLNALRMEQPIQYYYGETFFYNLKLIVNSKVLIPRPETEDLVSDIIDTLDDNSRSNRTFRILDIGTGSGAIAITLAKNLQNVDVFAADVSQEALEVAKQNAVLNDVDVTFMKLDILKEDKWNSYFQNFKFDLIVSNPPYVRENEKKMMRNNVLNYEPSLALFVEDENPLIFYKAILKFSKKYLELHGLLIFEINEYLGSEMLDLMRSNNFENIALLKDLFGKERIIKGIKIK